MASQEFPPGRVVLNHSTHVEGLIPVLEEAAKQPGIKTITPGVIGRAKGKTPRLNLRISVAIRGGFKVVARRGNTVQEVFILTTLEQGQLEQILQECLERRA